jgi:molybdopterin-guanine dinucleotide biosynthesis protein B
MSMKAVMIKGYKKTGKTTTAEAVIAELRRRGYSVGTVKNIHEEDFSIDGENTDTSRHAQSGAALVCARSPRETALIFNVQLPIKRILALYADFDYVILEGDSGADCPRVITGKTACDLDDKWDERTIAVSGIISAALAEYRGRPAINALTEISRLVDLIESRADGFDFADGL